MESGNRNNRGDKTGSRELRSIQSTRVAEVMHRNPKVVHPDTELIEVACMMRDGDFGAMPVCENDRLKGFITDRDIVVRGIADGLDLKSSSVRHVMTPEFITCLETAPVEEVENLMCERQVRRVMVLNDRKRLVGIVSLADLARAHTLQPLAVEALEEISQPSHREPMPAGQMLH